MFLAALVEAVNSEDATEREFVISLLRNRDELMERIRRRVLDEDPDMPAEVQSALFAATTLFEHRLARAVEYHAAGRSRRQGRRGGGQGS